MTPQLLGDLLRSPELLPLRLIALRELLPGANVSSMVAQEPRLLMRPTDELAGAVQQLRELLKVDHIDQWVARQAGRRGCCCGRCAHCALLHMGCWLLV